MWWRLRKRPLWSALPGIAGQHACLSHMLSDSKEQTGTSKLVRQMLVHTAQSCKDKIGLDLGPAWLLVVLSILACSLRCARKISKHFVTCGHPILPK